jgi:acetyl esterase/lipase
MATTWATTTMTGWSRRRAPLALAGVAASLLGGCSTVGVLNAVEPKGGLTIIRDLAYADGPRHRLDVYAPRQAARPAPVVVFFYGGNWNSGEKAAYAFVGAALARRGYVVVIPDYRLYPEVRWPSFVEDSAKAVGWARAHTAQYGGAPDKLVLMGHSAGAYNAALLALDRRWLAAEKLDPRRDVRAVVGLAGPYDFLPLKSEELKTIFGPEAQRPATQPIAYVDGQAPPMLLATDRNDRLVDPGNSRRFADAIHAKGGRAETRVYGGVNHQLMIGAFAAPLTFLAPVLKDAAAFIDTNVGKARP